MMWSNLINLDALSWIVTLILLSQGVISSFKCVEGGALVIFLIYNSQISYRFTSYTPDTLK